MSNSQPHPEDQARDLYRRYGALPWSQLPEGTRTHFRELIRAGIDGAGRPLAPPYSARDAVGNDHARPRTSPLRMV